MLICSDNPLFDKSLLGAMRQQGYNVDTVGRTAEAVQRALSTKYDVVIIDSDTIGLSASDSAEVILRSCEGTNVILAVGAAGTGGAVGGRAVSGAAVLQKPLDIEEAVRLVRSLCEPPVVIQSNQIKSNPIKSNPIKQRSFRGP